MIAVCGRSVRITEDSHVQSKQLGESWRRRSLEIAVRFSPDKRWAPFWVLMKNSPLCAKVAISLYTSL